MKNKFYHTCGLSVPRQNGKNGAPEGQIKKLLPKRAVSLSATQEESWWRLPDGLDKKEQRYILGFLFGTDDTAPWQWDAQHKHPILYWETTEKKNE